MEIGYYCWVQCFPRKINGIQITRLCIYDPFKKCINIKETPTTLCPKTTKSHFLYKICYNPGSNNKIMKKVSEIFYIDQVGDLIIGKNDLNFINYHSITKKTPNKTSKTPIIVNKGIYNLILKYNNNCVIDFLNNEEEEIIDGIKSILFVAHSKLHNLLNNEKIKVGGFSNHLKITTYNQEDYDFINSWRSFNIGEIIIKLNNSSNSKTRFKSSSCYGLQESIYCMNERTYNIIEQLKI